MKRNRLIWILVSVLCVSTISCRKYSGFKRDSSGFYYQFHQVNEQNPKPDTGDFVVVNMSLRTDEAVITPMTQNNILIDHLYRGDIYSALCSMHLGDSATFIFDGRKFYEEFLCMGEYPYGKDPIYADVKLLKITLRQNLEKAEKLYNEQMKRIRKREDSLICEYVDQYFADYSTYNGIRYYYNAKGSGPKPTKDQKVQVLFRGLRLDNSVFAFSTDPTSPLQFEVGKGQAAMAWDAMLLNMSVGDRITMIVPSSMAYGERGSEEFNVPPYTPVIYELELLKIVE